MLDADACAEHAHRRGLRYETAAAPATDPDVLALIAQAVDEGNARLSRVEQIKRHTVLADDWQPGSDVLTPTLKLRRKPIAQRYVDTITSMYDS